MEITEHIDALRLQGTLLADAAERAGLDATVPPCPSWQVKDLLRHTGYIHRWAARHLTERPAQVLDGPSEAEILAGGDPGRRAPVLVPRRPCRLGETLQDADPDLDCPAFMPAPSPLAFWARRQAHETAIHHADAQSAGAAVPVYAPGFAADGIDELIMGFGRRRKYQPAAGVDGGRLHVAAADTGDEWLIDAREGRMQPRRKDAEDPAKAGAITSACTVRGPAAAVYLYLWNRADAAQPGIAITGNADLLACWQASVRVRWG